MPRSRCEISLYFNAHGIAYFEILMNENEGEVNNVGIKKGPEKVDGNKWIGYSRNSHFRTVSQKS